MVMTNMAVGPTLMATAQAPTLSPACCWTPGRSKSKGKAVAAADCPRATAPTGREKSHTVPRNNPFSIRGLMFFGKPGLVVSSSPCSTSPTIPVLQEIQLGECIGRERQPGHVHFMPFFWVQYTKSKTSPSQATEGLEVPPNQLRSAPSGQVWWNVLELFMTWGHEAWGESKLKGIGPARCFVNGWGLLAQTR